MVCHEACLRARVFVRCLRRLPLRLWVDRRGGGRGRGRGLARRLELVRCRAKGCLEHDGRSGDHRRRRRLVEPRRRERERRRSSATSGKRAVLSRRSVRIRQDVRGDRARRLLPGMHRRHVQRGRRRPMQFRNVQRFVCERCRLSVRASLQLERNVHAQDLQRHVALRRDPRMRRRLLPAHQMRGRNGLSRRDSMPEHAERRALCGVVSHLSVNRSRGAESRGLASRERTVLGTADAGRARRQ